MHPFEPRRVVFHGVRCHGDWRLKRYSILYGSGRVDWEAFAPALRLVERALPEPAIAPGRLGVGFVIAHQGRMVNYTVLGWWDNENELPLRIWVSPDRRAESWRVSEGSESVCIWDLEVLWAEREAYIATILGAGGPDPSAYLARASAAAPAGESRGA